MISSYTRGFVVGKGSELAEPFRSHTFEAEKLYVMMRLPNTNWVQYPLHGSLVEGLYELKVQIEDELTKRGAIA